MEALPCAATMLGTANTMMSKAELLPSIMATLFFKNKFIYLIYLFLVALGLRCCEWAFSSCGEWGLLFVVVHGLLIAVASLVAEHGF